MKQTITVRYLSRVIIRREPVARTIADAAQNIPVLVWKESYQYHFIIYPIIGYFQTANKVFLFFF